MDIKEILGFAATVLLFGTSLFYGLMFVRKQNYLIGWEWWIMSLSTGCVIVFLVTDSQTAYDTSMFLDRFTRALGIPLVTVAGLMAVTHGFKPSMRTDIVLFVIGFAVTVAIVSVDFLIAIQPYFLLLGWTLFSVFLVYFAYRLARAGEAYQAAGVIVAMVTNQCIATIYDFFPIPGDDDHTIFYIFALTSWSYLVVQLYYAYAALEQANARNAGPGNPITHGAIR